MTIESIPANDRRERFIASGGQTVFPFDFPIYAAADLAVRRLRGLTESLLALNTDYTVTGANEQAGGSITLTSGAVAADVLTLTSAQPSGRSARFTNGGDFPAAAIEGEFNRLQILIQQILDTVARSLRLSETDPSSAVLPAAPVRAGHYLGFDEQGTPIAVAAGLSGAVVTPYAQTLLDDLTAAAARETLGSTTIGDALFVAASMAAARAALGSTTVGDAVFVAASTAAARLALNAAPQLTTGAGIAGSMQAINSGTGSALVAPSGGTWIAWWFGVTSASGIVTGVPEMGEVAGGTVLKASNAGVAWYGFAIRKL